MTIEIGVFEVPLARSVRSTSPSGGVAAAEPARIPAVTIIAAATGSVRVHFTIRQILGSEVPRRGLFRGVGLVCGVGLV